MLRRSYVPHISTYMHAFTAHLPITERTNSVDHLWRIHWLSFHSLKVLSSRLIALRGILLRRASVPSARLSAAFEHRVCMYRAESKRRDFCRDQLAFLSTVDQLARLNGDNHARVTPTQCRHPPVLQFHSRFTLCVFAATLCRSPLPPSIVHGCVWREI